MRPIQGQRDDCHIRYVDLPYIISFYETYPGPIRQHSMTSTFNDLLRDIRHCHLQYANIQWASTRPIQAQRDCHIRYVHLQYIHEVYQGPMWLRQPKYDPPTLHWVCTRYMQGQRDCHIDQQTFNTYTRYIQDQRDCAKPWMSFYETYPGPIRQHSMTSTRHTWLSPTIRQHSMSFYETYPSPAWLPYTICRPSIHTRGISRTNVTRPT